MPQRAWHAEAAGPGPLSGEEASPGVLCCGSGLIPLHCACMPACQGSAAVPGSGSSLAHMSAQSWPRQGTSGAGHQWQEPGPYGPGLTALHMLSLRVLMRGLQAHARSWVTLEGAANLEPSMHLPQPVPDLRRWLLQLQELAINSESPDNYTPGLTAIPMHIVLAWGKSEPMLDLRADLEPSMQLPDLWEGGCSCRSWPSTARARTTTPRG